MEKDIKQSYTTYLRYSTVAALKELSYKKHIPQSEIVQAAVNEYLNKQNYLLNSGTSPA